MSGRAGMTQTMELEAALEVAHVVGVLTWGAALFERALRGPDGRIPSAVAGLGAYVSVLTGVWLLHRDPSLLTMTHMRLKFAGLIALGALDHGLGRATPPPALAGRGRRIGALGATLALIGIAALSRPGAA